MRRTHDNRPEDEIRARIGRIVCDVLDPQAIAIRADLDLRSDLGANSLDMVEIVMLIEEDFSISIEDIAAIKTVGDLVAIVRSKEKERAA